MKKAIKRMASLALAAFLVLSFAACGGAAGGGAASGGASTSTPAASSSTPAEEGGGGGGGGDVTIRALAYGNARDEEITQNACRRFEAANPGYLVDLTFTSVDGWANFIQKWITMNVGNDRPDVVGVAIEGAQMAIHNDLTIPLNDYIENDEYMKNYMVDLPENMQAPFKKGDEIHGIWKGGQSAYLFYNKDVFDAAGVDYPKQGINWDEFYELCGQLTSGEGDDKIFGYLVPTVTSIYWTSPWFFSNGADVVNDEWTEPTFTDPGIVEAVEFVASIKDAGYSPDPVGADGVSMLANGKIAMYCRGRQNIWEWHDSGFTNFGMVSMPQKVKQQTVFGGGYWCISKGAAEPDVCFQLVKELLSEETLAEICKGGQEIPPTEKLAKDPEIMGEFLGEEIINRIWDDLAAARPVASPYFYAAIEPAYQRAFENILSGVMTAEEALAQAQEEAVAAMAAI